MVKEKNNKISERQEDVLNKVVREYIRTALPISSNYLREKYKMDVSSATIRLDFSELTEKGYLEKNYVSGGRAPTDKGFRFFVNKILAEKEKGGNNKKELIKKRFKETFKKAENEIEIEKEIARIIASFSSNLSIVFDENLNLTLRNGWKKVVREPEFCHSDYFSKFVEFVDNLEDNIDKIIISTENDFEIYIGNEMPLPADKFSLIVSKEISFGENKSVVAIVGPKRMDFRKNFDLIYQLVEVFNKKVLN